MTSLARRRGLAGVLVGAALVLAGCAVPGQPAAPGAAAAYDDATIANEQVNELYEVWRDEAGQSTSRRSVVTIELMREPLIAAAEELDYPYHRSLAKQQAQTVLQMQGLNTEPSETLIDAVEGVLLIGIFTVTPELTPTLHEVSAQVEADAVTSARTGDFSSQAFGDSLTSATETAMSLANQGMPVWAVGFRGVNAFTDATAPWLSSESATTQ